MNVSVIGLGHMGTGIAESLMRAGHRVTVWNRSRSKMDPLVKGGAEAAASIADACHSQAVITMLSDDAAVSEVVFGPGGILANLPKGSVHISSSTISVFLANQLAAAHAEAGQDYVSAPVFGRPNLAAQGDLYVILAGASDVLEQFAPLLDAIGQKTFTVSSTPRDANLVKLSGNFLIATVIESLGEAFALVEKAGIDRRVYLDILTSSLFDAPVYKTYGGLVADRRFEPAGFAAILGQKDIRLALSAAEALDVPMPIASLLRDRFLALRAAGGERLDWTAIGALAERDAGVPLPEPSPLKADAQPVSP